MNQVGFLLEYILWVRHSRHDGNFTCEICKNFNPQKFQTTQYHCSCEKLSNERRARDDMLTGNNVAAENKVFMKY